MVEIRISIDSGNSTNLHLDDIPSFVEVDGSVPTNVDDFSNKEDHLINQKRTVTEGDALAHAYVASGEGDSTPSFVHVNDNYNYQDIIEIPKATFKFSSLSLDESMIDSSNIESVTLASDGRVNPFGSSEQEMEGHDLRNTDRCSLQLLEKYAQKGENLDQQNNETPVVVPFGVGQINPFDSLEQNGIAKKHNSLSDTNIDSIEWLPEVDANKSDKVNKLYQTNNEPLVDALPDVVQTNAFDGLEQDGIGKQYYFKQNNTSNCDTPVNTTSEVSLGQSCYINVGKHLFETSSADANTGPISTHKLLQSKDSDTTDPSSDSADVAEYLFPNDRPVNTKISFISKVWNVLRLSCFVIIASVLTIHWYQSDEAFEVDDSVEMEPLTLDVDIAAKIDYQTSQHGTEILHLPHNINISQVITSRHKEEWSSFQTKNEPDFLLGELVWSFFLPIVSFFLQIVSFFLHIVINNLSLANTSSLCVGVFLISLQVFLRSKLKKKEVHLSKKNTFTSPRPVKKCTRELKSLEKVNTFNSTFKHEIVRTNGSKTKVRRSSRIVLSPQVKMGHRSKLERCLMNDLNKETS